MLRDRASEGAQRRIAFSSERLPPKLERGHRNLWRDLYGPLEVKHAHDRPFSAQLESMRLGRSGLTTCVSTVEEFVRTPRCVAVADSDNFHLAVNLGSRPMLLRQLGREMQFEPGAMALVTDAEPGQFAAGADNRWLFLTMPAGRLGDLVRRTEDSVAMPLGHDLPAIRHLRRYLDIVLAPAHIEDDAALEDHIETTLLDLTALVLRAGREQADLARRRGRRAARLHMILTAIRTGCDAPSISLSAAASMTCPTSIELFAAGSARRPRMSARQRSFARSPRD